MASLCVWCVELVPDVVGYEVRCAAGHGLRYYQGVGFKKRCPNYCHDNIGDTIARADDLLAMGYQFFIRPQMVIK